MGKISQTQLETILVKKDLRQAWEILSENPDLRHAEIPPVDKKIFAGIAQDEGAVREFALAMASPVSSVRVFCKKYLARLGQAVADDLFRLAIETIDPLRPVPLCVRPSLRLNLYASSSGERRGWDTLCIKGQE